MENMNGFDEFKEAYRVIKEEYSFPCVNVIPPEDDDEGYEFVFRYLGIPIHTEFSYLWFDTPYPELDRVIFNGDGEDEIEFTTSRYFAITNLIKAFQDCRYDKKTMVKIIDYLNDEVLDG